MAENLRRDESESHTFLQDSSWTLFYQHGRCTLRLGSGKVGFTNGSIIFSFYFSLVELRKVNLGIRDHIWLIHPGALHIEPSLKEEAAGPQFTSTKLGWPVCSRSQN